ncbi:TRAP transporter large permease [Clostridiaceae bacterium]|nr:TRAP transporter large permease [Clostridiaceae bacterium]RKI09307.1 TRAP transporter large permease [bacterium 1XD21-70]
MIFVMFLSFAILMVIGVPIAFAMGSASLLFMQANDISLAVAAQKFFSNTQSFSFLAVPFFILAGNLMVESGIAKKLINFASVLVRQLPGGLGCVSVVTSMIMAGISGSSVADASSVGAILIPEMNDQGYPKSFSAAINATSSVVGIIIPPSSTMIVISYITGLSVAKMFLAGAIPGILIGFAYLAVTVWMALKNNYPREERASKSEVIAASVDAAWAMLFPVFMLGSIILGIATPTESASICVVYSLLLGLFVYRSLNMKKILRALKDSAIGTTVVMMVVCTATIMQWILVSNNIPTMIADFLLGLNLPYALMLLVMILILFCAGMVMDNVPNLYIFLPIFMPIAIGMGMDPIHMSIVVLCSLAMGLFTPPVGTTLFISCNIAGISIEECVKDLIPFFIVGGIVILLVAYCPPLTMFLGNMM